MANAINTGNRIDSQLQLLSPFFLPALVSRLLHHRRPRPQLRTTNFNRNSCLKLVLEAQMPSNLATANGGRLIVPISGGTFTDLASRARSVPPSGDWWCSVRRRSIRLLNRFGGKI